ncbi:hypothetical protein SH661x_002866 [Planctomicrobium sp. SH661]|uniref:hypothetical protein n=1 Tax=Planctomicrobium sp. SH661 TaxID=3448124 RepID=UPI003F5BBE27
MGARHKLNAAAVHAILLIAGTVAYLVRSWIVFWILASALLASALHSGQIRPDRKRRR